MLRELQGCDDAASAHALISEALPERIAQATAAEDLEAMRKRLVKLPVPTLHTDVRKEDFTGALAVFLLVFLSTFPVTVPFMFIPDPVRALRLSNLVALVMLFLLGSSLAKHTGGRPLRLGSAMLVLGLVLVGVTIALGG